MRPTGAPGTRRRRREREPDQAQALEELRRLIVGPEQERLAEVEAREPVTPDKVAGVLPEAVARTSESRGRELAVSMEPAVTTVVRTFARRESALFGEILSPTIGAAVRKAVVDAIAAMMQRFNEALERSLSVQSVRWRIEARRTGRPFAEVVLLRTLVYRVEQVFLIHPGTGVLLEHVMDPAVRAPEPDQVAAMLEALDAYVREAFGTGPPDTHLSQIQFGDRVVWVDRASTLAVAAVVRGVAPRGFGDLLRETRERIALTHQAALAELASDVSPFADARPELEQCLRQERAPPPQRAHRWLMTGGALLLIALAAVFIRVVQHGQLLRAYTRALEAQPGIALTAVEWSGRRVRISGFRDPLAEPPAEVLARSGLAPADLRLEPFYSLHPHLVERRIRHALRPPEGVTLSFAGGTLSAEGTAPREWMEHARLLSQTLPGVLRYEETGLRSQEDIAALRAAAGVLEEIAVPFDFGSSALTARRELQRAAVQARRVLGAAGQARLPACILVTGHGDPAGPAGPADPAQAQALSEARAASVVEALREGGLPAGRLRAAGGGAVTAETPLERARSATFRVLAGGSGCPEGS